MAQCEGAVAAPYDFSIRYYKCLANYFCWWVQLHKKLSWEYSLALKVYTFLKPQLVAVSHYQSRSCGRSIRMGKKKIEERLEIYRTP